MDDRIGQQITDSNQVEKFSALHYDSIVIDTVCTGIHNAVPLPSLQVQFEKMLRSGLHRPVVWGTMDALSLKEIRHNPEARRIYWETLQRSGLTACLHTVHDIEPEPDVFEKTVAKIGKIHAIANSIPDKICLALTADDIVAAHNQKMLAVLLYFQNTTVFGDNFDRLQLFHDLGVRVVQLTYNLRNLVGDGCTERNPAGLSRFGIEMVRHLNKINMLIDTSHCSEKTVWDTLKVSSKPIMMGHVSARAIFNHDRAKSDELIKSVAAEEGYIGLNLVPAFIQGGDSADLHDFIDHIKHVVDLAGVDAVGIGTDIGHIWEKMPPDVPAWTYRTFYQQPPPQFSWHGFSAEHRNASVRKIVGYETLEDWPNITIHLGNRGFTEEDIKKIIGINFLEYFKRAAG